MRVDELGAAIFAALAAHPWRRPLCLFSDGATALRCVAAARSDGATADLPLARPGLAHARASAAHLAIHGAPTSSLRSPPTAPSRRSATRVARAAAAAPGTPTA